MNNEPKKLYRIEEGKVLCGVCAGCAEYLNMDVNTTRILFVVICLVFFPAVIAYFVAAALLPIKQSMGSTPTAEKTETPAKETKDAKVVEEKTKEEKEETKEEE